MQILLQSSDAVISNVGFFCFLAQVSEICIPIYSSLGFASSVLVSRLAGNGVAEMAWFVSKVKLQLNHS